MRPGLRRRRERRTYLAVGVVDSRHAPLRVDEELWNGFVYTVGVHARNPALALHDLSFDGTTYWILLSADLGNCEAFADAVGRDFGGYLRAYLGDDELTIQQAAPRLLGEPERAAGARGPC